MLYHVARVRTEILEELSASIIRVTRIGELGVLAVTSNRCTVQRNTSQKTAFLRSPPWKTQILHNIYIKIIIGGWVLIKTDVKFNNTVSDIWFLICCLLENFQVLLLAGYSSKYNSIFFVGYFMMLLVSKLYTTTHDDSEMMNLKGLGKPWSNQGSIQELPYGS
jgi:hypothetical protein